MSLYVLYFFLQRFDDWLSEIPEVKYLIDGANCAYSKQNHIDGKFSFRQIELVVDKIAARKDGNILVIIPHCYTQKQIPNSCARFVRRNFLTPEDEVRNSVV